MSGEVTDWVPNYELGCWAQTVQRWRNEGMPDGEACVGDMFEGEPFFRIDRRDFAKLDTRPIPDFGYEVLEETERYIIARHGNGVVTKALKEGAVDGVRMSMDQYLSFPVTDRASWQELKRRYDAGAPNRYPRGWEEDVLRWRERDYPLCLLQNASFGLYSHLRSWVGTEGISYMFYEEPALVEEMVEYATEFILGLMERALGEVEFDYFNFFEDCAGKGSPLIGPELFRRFLMPSYKRIIERFHRAGIRSVWVDSDGDPEVLIPLWMECGVNCFWPLEQASGMDPNRLRRKFGKGLVLCGGIDKREIARGRDAIERELRGKIPPMLEDGGYIPHIDHMVPPDISYDNFMYYLELKLKLIGRG
jgi:uroporphyrinogen decarboxylase